MPYKENLKNPSSHSRTKPKYKVTNWTEYNKSLGKRGAISLYFPTGDLEKLLVNTDTYVAGCSGQQVTYKPVYIEF